MEWQHQGVVASRVRMALHCEAIRRVAARMDVRADGGHWSWAGAAGNGWTHDVAGVTADRDWLAATSCGGWRPLICGYKRRGRLVYRTD